jgi:hypothetical protein
MLTYTRAQSRQVESSTVHLDVIVYTFSDGEQWQHVTRWEQPRGRGRRTWVPRPPVVLRNGIRVAYTDLTAKLAGAEEEG